MKMVVTKPWKTPTWLNLTNRLSNPSSLADSFGLPNILPSQLPPLRNFHSPGPTAPEYLLAQTSLQCILVGPALPCNSLALKILDVPQANAPTATAHYVVQSLKAYIQVHNVWIHQVFYHNDPTPPADTNVFIALISTPAGDEGGLNLV
ncbi:uncharacterized protein UBRO2_01115 [Ustilago bromivora]|uniref:Uncharacterized protein n=1 Tax=Ustilago bromivora TaxID=307758 RepID=A0A8H8QIP6_9BASI|nr:uncharacterized protein UBRO2_01115 [Ustilago bromivora]